MATIGLSMPRYTPEIDLSLRSVRASKIILILTWMVTCGSVKCYTTTSFLGLTRVWVGDMRVWVCWMVAIILLLSAVADVVPSSQPTRSAPASSLTLASHSATCFCRVCHGRTACCCKGAKTPLQTAAMTACCDTPQTKQLVAKSLFPATLVETTAAICPRLVASVFSRPQCQFRSHTVLPLLSPPRSLSTPYSV